MPLVEEIRRIVEDYLQNSRWTSASPGHINTLLHLISTYEPNPDDLLIGREPLEPRQPPGPKPITSDVSPSSLLQLPHKVSDPQSIFLDSQMLARMVPFIAVALAAPATIKLIAEALQAPGSPFDSRFKRVIQNEIATAVERDLKQKISQGIVMVRISSSPGFRGEAAVGQSGLPAMKGSSLYDSEFERLSKGLDN